MNVNGVTSPVPNPVGVHRPEGDAVLPGKENMHTEATGGAAKGSDDPGVPQAKLEKKETAVNLEELVLRPSEVSFEERMKQVISFDDMKRLLYLYSPYRMEIHPEGSDLTGRVVDLKS